MISSALSSLMLVGFTLFAFASLVRAEENGTGPATKCQPSEATCDQSDKSEVRVNIHNKCMCIGSDDCFLIAANESIKDNPNYKKDQTKPDANDFSPPVDGKGVIGRAKGDFYKTTDSDKPKESYDNDALDMGIKEATDAGAWLYKPEKCKKIEEESTSGGIAIPCSKWKDLWNHIGKVMSVCGTGKKSKQSSAAGDSTELHQKKKDNENGDAEDYYDKDQKGGSGGGGGQQ